MGADAPMELTMKPIPHPPVRFLDAVSKACGEAQVASVDAKEVAPDLYPATKAVRDALEASTSAWNASIRTAGKIDPRFTSFENHFKAARELAAALPASHPDIPALGRLHRRLKALLPSESDAKDARAWWARPSP